MEKVPRLGVQGTQVKHKGMSGGGDGLATHMSQGNLLKARKLTT